MTRSKKFAAGTLATAETTPVPERRAIMAFRRLSSWAPAERFWKRACHQRMARRSLFGSSRHHARNPNKTRAVRRFCPGLGKPVWATSPSGVRLPPLRFPRRWLTRLRRGCRKPELGFGPTELLAEAVGQKSWSSLPRCRRKTNGFWSAKRPDWMGGNPRSAKPAMRSSNDRSAQSKATWWMPSPWASRNSWKIVGPRRGCIISHVTLAASAKQTLIA